VHALDEAITRLDPARVSWLETTVWQKAGFGDFTYEADGRYLTAPKGRFRLELTTRHGSSATTYLVIGDGKAIWEGTRFDGGSWQPLTRADLQPTFGGVLPMLHALRACMTWTSRETVRRQGRIFTKLAGALSDLTAGALASSDRPWPKGLPHKARVYLDSETLWPHRVEWWGRRSLRSADALLVQMEFRDPRFNQPLSAERCTTEFSFPNSAQPFLAQQKPAR
jgi:hypothetical protein